MVERVERLESALADVRTGAVGARAARRVGRPRPPGRRRARPARSRGAIPRSRSSPSSRTRPSSRARSSTAASTSASRAGRSRRPARAAAPVDAPARRAAGRRATRSPPRAEIGLARLGPERALVCSRATPRPRRHDAIVAGCHALGFAPPTCSRPATLAFAAGLVLTSDAVAIVEAPRAARPPARSGGRWRAQPLASTARRCGGRATSAHRRAGRGRPARRAGRDGGWRAGAAARGAGAARHGPRTACWHDVPAKRERGSRRRSARAGSPATLHAVDLAQRPRARVARRRAGGARLGLQGAPRGRAVPRARAGASTSPPASRSASAPPARRGSRRWRIP